MLNSKVWTGLKYECIRDSIKFGSLKQRHLKSVPETYFEREKITCDKTDIRVYLIILKAWKCTALLFKK